MFITQVCQALNKAKVEYAVVGGYAVALHGAVRSTVDVDLVLALKKEAFIKAEKCFLAMRLRSKLPVDGKQVFEFREEYIRNRNLIAWSFYDPIHPANQLDVVITDDVRKMICETMKIQGVSVRVASIKSLIQMKKRAGRKQDLEDIRALEGIKDEK